MVTNSDCIIMFQCLIIFDYVQNYLEREKEIRALCFFGKLLNMGNQITSSTVRIEKRFERSLSP